MIALCGEGMCIREPFRALQKAWNDVLVRHGGSQLGSFIACSADGVSSMAMLLCVVIRTLTRLLPLYFRGGALLSVGFFGGFPTWLSSRQCVRFSSPQTCVSLCSESRLSIVRWCSTAENDVIFRDRRPTCRAFCAWLRAVAGVGLQPPDHTVVDVDVLLSKSSLLTIDLSSSALPLTIPASCLRAV